jgi:hypothetical protein
VKEASILISIVTGFGLTALSAGGHTGSSTGIKRPAWHAPLFTLVVQLIGFMLAGTASLIVVVDAERGKGIPPADLRAENWFIVALVALIAVVAVRNAWVGMSDSSVSEPWGEGLAAKISRLFTFSLAVLVLVIVGVCLVFGLAIAGQSHHAFFGTFLLILLAVAAVLFIVSLGLRRLLGAELASSESSRRYQQQLLAKLEGLHGAWLPIKVKPVVGLEPELAFHAMVWANEGGWHMRSDDAYALGRYHAWAASHTKVPAAALHQNRVGVWAGKVFTSMRGLHVVPTTRKLWWIDVWRFARARRSSIVQKGAAGLLRIAHEDLAAAGLVAVVESVSTRERSPLGSHA